MLVDTHAHLFENQFNDDLHEVLLRAQKEGVSSVLLPNIDLESMEAMHALSESSDMCIPMMGLHPSSVKDSWKSDLLEIEKCLFASPDRYIAVGEIGIDLYWDKTFKTEQIEVFREQIRWAKALQKPVSIHVREAFNEVFEVLEQENDDSLTGIFHCFTGHIEQAKKILSFGGFKLGIGGVVTFKNAKIAEVLKQIDLSHLVLETDAPYLAPTPYRGKRNESAYLKEIAEKLADIYGVDYPTICRQTSENAEAIFNLSSFLNRA